MWNFTMFKLVAYEWVDLLITDIRFPSSTICVSHL